MGRKRRRPRDEPNHFPGWAWMLFGLAIGLSVALAIYVNGHNAREPLRPTASASAGPSQPAPQSSPAPVAHSPVAVAPVVDDEPAKPRFDFYSMLPNFEVIIPEQEPDVSTDIAEKAVVQPGVYVLQAGSFTQHVDADRRRAQLALQGIESTIQRVTIDDKTYHRVRIGPIEDLQQLNVLRSRLREAKIDVLRIRLGD
ncbi:MAG: SPOR domain-containing protein [Woeseia sp.]